MDPLAQVDRIIAGPAFRGAEALKNLLRYLAKQSIEANGNSVKEYQIALEALGRSTEFDPRTDSVVRVTVGRLRAKLDEHYAAGGRTDPWIVEIPKGSYRVVFKRRTGKILGESPVVASTATLLGRRSQALVAGLALILAAGVGFGVGRTGSDASGPPLDLALRTFWSAFVGDSQRIVVLYSNARFVGNEVTGLRYGQSNSAEGSVDLYTGIGEVMAVHALDRVFFSLGRPFEVKRSLLVDWEDIRGSDAVFVGGPLENLALNKLERPSSFRFEKDESAKHGIPAVLVNVDPQPGEQPVYRIKRPYESDYAVIRLVEGFDPNRRVLVLAGIRTLGTQAAVEFVSRPESVGRLLKRVELDGDRRLRPFEAALEVRINDGVPVESRVVAFRAAAP